MEREKSPMKHRLGTTYTVEEALHVAKIADALEHGFAPGEQRKLMADPLAKSFLKKMRAMRGAAQDVLAGSPRKAKRLRDVEPARAE